MSRFAAVKPKALPVGSSSADPDGDGPPVERRAPEASVSLAAWAAEHREWITETLNDSGALLLRGFEVPGVSGFRAFVRVLTAELLEYKERSTPRTEIEDRVYTSTEYPAHQSIALHNEFSYSYTWPTRIFFHAEIPAEEGGATPIADSRRVYEAVPAEIRDKFATRGVAYVRNYGCGVDLSWQDAFQTQDKAAVESYCAAADVCCEWLPGDRLRTRQVRPAVTRLPRTGETIWFNQAHLFHVSNLGPESEAEMRRVFADGDLPRHAFFGDGSPISNEDLDEVRRALDSQTVSFPWQSGDVLVLDNMRFAHGRQPYRGRRRVLTALSDPYALEPSLRIPGAVT